jgi:hypothetical protein
MGFIRPHKSVLDRPAAEYYRNTNLLVCPTDAQRGLPNRGRLARTGR